MKKTAYTITVFIISQLLLFAAITLWVVWYVIKKNNLERILSIAKADYEYLGSYRWGYATMVGGILFLSFILIASNWIFIDWIKTKIRIKQGSDFTSIFTHELMTPLTCVHMNLETLLSSSTLSEQKRKILLQAAFKESIKLQESIQSILDLKRLEHHKHILTLAPIDIANYLSEFVERVDRDNLSIYFDAKAKGNYWVMADLKYLNVIFNNLLDNAIKYSSGMVEIVIRFEVVKQRALIGFCDQGIGIPKKDLKRVFKIFYKSNKNKRGKGVGLYIVKNLLAQHKASIKALRLENGGTSFVINFPLVKS